MGEKTALMITEDIARAIDDLRFRIDISSSSKEIERFSKSILYLSIAHEKIMGAIKVWNTRAKESDAECVGNTNS